MADKTEDGSKDKTQKMVRLLKELDEKYKKVKDDRITLLNFLKTIFPSSGDAVTFLDAAPGLIDGEKLLAVYKQLETSKAKIKEDIERASKKIAEENEQLKAAERSLKQKLSEMENRTSRLETELQMQTKKQNELQKQIKQQASNEASVLLSKLKSAGLSDPYRAEFQHDKELLELKVREQADTILSLKSQLNDAQKPPIKHSTATTLKTKTKNEEVQTTIFGTATEDKVGTESSQKELTGRIRLQIKMGVDELRRKLGEVQFEYNVRMVCNA